jgi:AraC family transcriptional regulator of adaptative response / DNA-3-methyladenine glycosylase II
VDGDVVELGRVDEADFGGFVADGDLTADDASEVGDVELLADFAVGVGDDVCGGRCTAITLSGSGQRVARRPATPDVMATFSAVVTTGIYCRPGCGARPKAENVQTFHTAAAAEAAGFRACLRCRPYRTPGTVSWDAPELVCRAVRLIIDGVLDDGTEADLGCRLGLSARHLRRLFHEHLGLTPDQLARSRRAHFARRLLDDTDLTAADIAFASGFGSLRQFNRTMREIFRATPHQLREQRRRADRLVTDGGLALRLPVDGPYDWDAALADLAARAIPRVEAVDRGVYRRTIALDGGPGMLEVRTDTSGHLLLCAHLPYWEGLIHVVQRVRRMLGLDLDLAAATAHLTADALLGPLMARRLGLRVLGAWGPFEAGVHAIVRQDRDDAATAAVLGRIVRRHGLAVPGLRHGLTHAFPAAATLAAADLDGVGLATPESAAVKGFAAAVSAGDVVLDGSAALVDLVAAVTAIPGVDEPAAHLLAMRLGEPDAFPCTDPALRAAAERWRPWRSLATTHLTTGQAT